MVSVTQRIAKFKQPRGGYIKPKDFIVTDLLDTAILHENENIHSTLIGLAVDYLTRFLNGTSIEEAFKISLMGAINVEEIELAHNLLLNIKGVDDISIENTCKMVGFDVAYRAGKAMYKPVEFINPDKETISNIRVMVNRSLSFFESYGPIVKDGFTFEGGYTSLINTGDGDFLTKNTLWDFKVSKSAPTNKHTLQLLMYYLMGIHSVHTEFEQVENLGIFNPRLNKVYLLPINTIPDEIINEVNTAVIGY
ncbi:hypothetical protein [Bacillus cereus]|uniref:hypothetical protein n=1 Tax=Bacillus cereus TaxID=1396 RepID=UPI0021135F4D|nr:hypothetical protein [Bacillus cereus]